jgi:DNA-binding MarR family transcriptional regulator
MSKAREGEARYTRGGTAVAELIGESVRLHGRLLAASDRLSRDVGLSGARWQVLSVLGRSADPLTIATTARWMGLTRQSVQRIADALAADDLIEYLDNPGHRRAQLARLTVRGRTLLQRLDRRRFLWANRVAASLDVAALEAALGTLRRVRERLGEQDTQIDRSPSPARRRRG